MKNVKLLDCTLRDGGYITQWVFGYDNMLKIVRGLTDANIDMIEIGYLNKDATDKEKSTFRTIADASALIPAGNENKCVYLAMADIDQFRPEDLEPYKPGYIDGIRVVFYKHQIEKALVMCKAVADAGYKLFVQPMVTIDYTLDEYNQLIEKVKTLKPYAVSIVDSFGYMSKGELFKYYQLLDANLPKDVIIGFHSHNNMQMALMNAEALLSDKRDREIIIDASLYGMGRGAGNLNTELIANYYNETIEYKYNLHILLMLIGKYIYPINQKTPWGYSPYFYLTALYHCHPNYVTYLLSEHNVSVMEFEQYLKSIPVEYKTKCRKPKVLELYDAFESGVEQ